MTAPPAAGLPLHPPFTPIQVTRGEEWGTTGIIDLVTLEPLDDLLFRNRMNQANSNGALFGGQVLAQALAAACGTIGDERAPHSLHGYFLRPGRCDRPVTFQVDRTRDGGRLSTRRVIALQHGEPILHMECSFRMPEPGFEHQSAAPAVPAPEACPTLPELLAAHADLVDPEIRERYRDTAPLELRPVGIEQYVGRLDHPERMTWLRIPSAGASDNPVMHQIVLTYLSDYWLAGTPLSTHLPIADWNQVYMASIDHAVWFHRPVRADAWLLYHMTSPAATGGTGLSQGRLYDRAGALVATVMQETLLRQRK